MIIQSPNDVAFNLFGISIYWYGIIMAFGIFIAIITANNLFNFKNSRGKDIILDSAPIIIIFGILFARIYFCLLNADYYFSHPIKILDIREGGLSIHGAILGGIFSTILMVKKYKFPFLKIIDPIACSTILGQAIGRWGNYFNSEAYGYPTLSQNWGLFIPSSKRISEFSNYSLFHPTFLYESILDLFAFFILLFIYKKTNSSGLTFFSYLTIYATIRFFIEKIRIDSALNVGSIPIAELISIILFITGILGLIFVLKKEKAGL
ncbi:prolipoprotein diacylglyceryl transferase [bacterium]|nr:prolipoprotein diacylglyceryl transferase [bacterium]